MKDDVPRNIEKVRKQLAKLEARRTRLLAELRALRKRQMEPHWLDTFEKSAFGAWFAARHLKAPGQKQPPSRGPSVDPVIAFRNQRIAAHSWLLEREGMPTEAAVTTVTRLYGVTRSTIFAARRQWHQLQQEYVDQVPPDQRRREIESLEQIGKSNRLRN